MGFPDVSHVFGLNTKQGRAIGVGSNRISAYDDAPCAFRRIVNIVQSPTRRAVIFQYPEGIEYGKVYFDEFIEVGNLGGYIGVEAGPVASYAAKDVFKSHRKPRCAVLFC